MIPLAPSASPDANLYRPVLEAIASVLVTPATLADHWGYTENHLANLRNAQKGLPFVKLPTGAVRYRVSEILAAELAGTEGPVTLERIELAIVTCPGVDPKARAAIVEHLRRVFPGKGGK